MTSKMDIEEYLQKFDKYTKDPTLEAMQYIMNEFGNEYEKIQYIHVAGTNGKGSICEMVNKVLIEAGYKVGKFISPHLITFNETICINNVPIPEERVKQILPKMAKVIEKYDSTHDVKVKWFEVITSLALIYFAEEKCDIAVVETGLGGLTDCTNIINKEISMIANIGYDHMDILGNSIQEIAKHKAGIIKQNCDTIYISQPDINNVIENTCREKNNKLHLVEKEKITDYRIDGEYQYFSYGNYKDVAINLKGKKQIENASMCLECMEVLKQKGYKISEENIRKALKSVVHRARFETICENPKMIFDGGHNEPAIANLKQTINQYYSNAKKVYIISILQTKDYHKIISQLVENNDAIYIFTSGNDKNRYVPKEDLYNEASKYTKNNIYKYELSDAINVARENYNERIIFIIGSFYVYKTVLQLIQGEGYDKA